MTTKAEVEKEKAEKDVAAKTPKQKLTQEDYQKKLIASTKEILKDLGAKALDLEAPTGSSDAISTGSVVVNLITGGGFPGRRMSCVAGESGAGKTTLLGKSMGIALGEGERVDYVDVEGAADYTWMLRNGTDVNKYLGMKATKTREERLQTFWYMPDLKSGDDAFRYLTRLLDSCRELEDLFTRPDKGPRFSTLEYLDSLAACVPEAEIENDEAGNKPDHALLMSKFLRLLRAKLRGSNSTFICTNQLRTNPRTRFGNPEYEPGGGAPQYYSDMRLWLDRISTPHRVGTTDKPHPWVNKEKIKALGIHVETNPDGSEDRYFFTKARTIKNRVFPPLKESYFRVWAEENGAAGRGIDPVWDVIRFHEELGQLEFTSRYDITFRGKEYVYFDLKKEILTKPDLLLECKDLLKTGKAFELYFARLSGQGIEAGKPSPEQAQEQAPPPEEAK